MNNKYNSHDITRVDCQILRADIIDALVDIAAKHSVNINTGQIRFADYMSLAIKLTISAVDNSINITTEEKALLKLMAFIARGDSVDRNAREEILMDYIVSSDAEAAVVHSLVKKGLVTCTTVTSTNSSNSDITDSTISLTEKGCKALWPGHNAILLNK